MAGIGAWQGGNLRLIGAALVVALAAMTITATAGASPAAKATVIPGQYIVVFKDSVERTEVIAEGQTERHGGELGPVFPRLNGYGAELSKDAVEALRENPKVQYVVPNHRVSVTAQTLPTGLSRTYAAEQPALDIDETDDVRIDADIAVIDTGIDYLHPDLNVVARTECSMDEVPCVDGVGTDKYGHGTHVGGIVGALDNNFGAVGMAPGARLWSVRVLGDNGKGSEFTVLQGIEWVTAHAAEIEVANMSLGRVGDSAPWLEAIAKSVNAGVVYVVAAGNNNEDANNFTPANSSDAITVSSLSDYDGKVGGLTKQNCETNLNRGEDDVLAAYSNWGNVIDIAAPGSCIYSTLPTTGSFYGTDYKAISGTSMAAPHVAGAAAILAAKSNPNSKKDVEAIRNTLIGEGSLNWTDDSGDGVKEPLLDLRPPTSEAATFPASNLQTYSAKLNAVLSAGGLASSYRFEYGTTTSYGQSAPVSPKSIGAGVGDLEASETIAVKPETTYHYRVALTNSKGTFYGEDQTFKATYWSAQEISNPPAEDGKGSQLRGASCLSTDFCMAVGDYSKKMSPTSYRFRATAQRWDGQKWTVLAVPIPAGFGDPDATGLESVSCASPSACTAVGWGSINGKRATFAVRWNGAEWSVQSTPVPAGVKGGYELSGVACASATACTAVGYYVAETEGLKDTEERKILIEAWNGSEWQIQAASNPAGKKIGELNGISCSAASACTAVGSSKTVRSAAERATLIERWNGSAWSIQASPNAPGAVENELEDVSCSSPSACTAVGNTNKVGGGSLQNDPVGFAMGWNGSEWQVSTSQLPGPLYSVSCLGNGSCHALGRTIGRHWDGSSWSAEDPLVSPIVTQFKAEALSCLAKMPCTAVGSYYGPRSNPGFQPLAEHLPAPQGTPSATAARLAAESYPASIGSTGPYGTQAWKFHTAQQHCDAPQLEGILEGQSAKQEAGAKDAACYDNYTGNQLKMNGCKFLYRPGAKTGATTFKGTVDIYCPTGQPIAFYSPGTMDCQVAVPAQYGIPATYENVGAGKERAVKVTVSATGLKHSQASGYNCGGSIGSYADGIWSGSWKIQGSSQFGANGLWVIPSEVAGIALPPAGIAIDGSPPKLVAGTYPIAIAGDQKEGAQHAMSFASGLFKCTTASLSSTVSGATAQLSLTPEYSGCTTGGLPSTVNTNGCTYTFNVLNQPPSGSTYAGHADIACPAGKAIEIVVKNTEKVKCTITIGSQTTDAGGLSLTNEAATATIGLGLAVNGIDYQQVKGEGLGVCASGSYTTGTYTGSSTLVGSY